MDSLSHKLSRFPFFLFLLIFFSGCAGQRPLPVELPLFSETWRFESSGTGSLVWDPIGERILVVSDAVLVADVASRSLQDLGHLKARSAAWSLDGRHLALDLAGGAEDGQSRVVVLSAEGEMERELTLPGRVAGLLWAEDDKLLIGAATIRTFSFGANLSLTLHIWRSGEDLVSTKLFDATLKPATARYLGESFATVTQFALSPWGDEILYSRLHDPPRFAPYQRLVLRNIESGKEREVASRNMDASGLAFSTDGESVFYSTGRAKVVRQDPWDGRILEEFTVADPLRHLAAAGPYLLLGTQLHKEGEAVVARLPGDARLAIDPGGHRLAVQRGNLLQIFLLPERAGMPSLPSGEALKKLKWLRRWRSQGLITPDEYREQKQRIMTP